VGQYQQTMMRRVSQGSMPTGTSTPTYVSVTQLAAQRNDVPRFGAEDSAKMAGQGVKAQDVVSKLRQEPSLQERFRASSEVPSQFNSPRHSPRHSRRPSTERHFRPSLHRQTSEKGLVEANAEFRQAMKGLKKKKPAAENAPDSTKSSLRLNHLGASSSSREACYIQAWLDPQSKSPPRGRDGKYSGLSVSTGSAPPTSLLVKTAPIEGIATDEGTTCGESEASMSLSHTDIRQFSMVSSMGSSTAEPHSPETGRLVSQASTDIFGSFGSSGNTSLSQLFRERGSRSHSNMPMTPPASRSCLNSPREKKKKRTWSPRPSRKGVESTENMPSLKAAALAAVNQGNPGLRSGILSGKISPRKLSPPGSPRQGSPRNSPPRQARPEALAESARDSLSASFQQYNEKNRRRGQDGFGSPGRSPRGRRERVPREPGSSSHLGGSHSEQSLAAVAAKATGKVAKEAPIEEARTPRQLKPTRDLRERPTSTAESNARSAAPDAEPAASPVVCSAADAGHAAPPSPRDAPPRPGSETNTPSTADALQAQANSFEAAAAPREASRVWVRPPEEVSATSVTPATVLPKATMPQPVQVVQQATMPQPSPVVQQATMPQPSQVVQQITKPQPAQVVQQVNLPQPGTQVVQTVQQAPQVVQVQQAHQVVREAPGIVRV